MPLKSLAVVVTLGLVLAIATGGAARAESPVEPGKLFVGPEGMTVAIVPLKPRTERKVLVQVTGSGTAFDGKALPHTVEDSGGTRVNYETTYRGRAFNTVVVRDGRYSVFLPGRRDSLTVSYDDTRTKQLVADEVYKAYQRQQADGSLTKLMAFDRKDETARHETQLEEPVAAFQKGCGTKPALKVDWASFSDADLREISVASYCGEPLEKLAYLCGESREAKQTISSTVKTFSCALGPAMKLDLAGTTLAWTTSRSATNMGDFTRKFAESRLVPAAAATTTPAAATTTAAGEAPPWGKAATLGERMTLEKTGVCTDGKSHYVIVAPNDKQLVTLYYGDGKTFYRVPAPPWVLSGDHFFEPRFLAKSKNSNFRGVDMRAYGEVSYEAAKQTCTAFCGERKTSPHHPGRAGQAGAAAGQGHVPAPAAHARALPPGARRAGPLLLRRPRQHPGDREELPPVRRCEGGDEAAEDDQHRRRHRGRDLHHQVGLAALRDRSQEPAGLDPGRQEDQADRRPARGNRRLRRARQQLPAHLQRPRGLPRRTPRQPLRRDVTAD